MLKKDVSIFKEKLQCGCIISYTYYFKSGVELSSSKEVSQRIKSKESFDIKQMFDIIPCSDHLNKCIAKLINDSKNYYGQ